MPKRLDSFLIAKKIFLSEYATVGYMAKRIQMRKNRYQTLQKAADAKKAEAAASAPPPPPPGMPPQGGPPPGLNNGGMSNQHSKHSVSFYFSIILGILS